MPTAIADVQSVKDARDQRGRRRINCNGVPEGCACAKCGQNGIAKARCLLCKQWLCYHDMEHARCPSRNSLTHRHRTN